MRTYLRGFRGVRKGFLATYVAVYETMTNAKAISAEIIQRMCFGNAALHAEVTWAEYDWLPSIMGSSMGVPRRIFLLVTRTVWRVPQGTVAIVERRGRFSRVAYSGYRLLVPHFETLRSVKWTGMRQGSTEISLGEQRTHFPLQPAVTKDNITISVDVAVSWRIGDPVKAVYSVHDPISALTRRAVAGLQGAVGELSHALVSAETIAELLVRVLKDETQAWGVTVTGVDVRDIARVEMAASADLALERFRRALGCVGLNLKRQGVLFETLGGERLLSSNAEAFFDLASVTKLATSAAALERLGTDPVPLLKRMNAYSDNEIAEAIGKRVGGAEGVADTLARYGIERSAIRLSSVSGLGPNLMRPVDVIRLLRALAARLYEHGYAPVDILPVAGGEPGTLEARFRSPDAASCVVAKTGTLWRGISTLAGYLYTRDRGAVVFAILNEGACPYGFPPSQDLLVREMLAICGGAAPAASSGW